jgi:phenylalanyl-tRNA synthetase beta chain
MKASVRWLNSLLDPGDLSAADVEHILTHVGFPIDARETLPSGDTRLEVELTSNRGDCLSHIGLARELAAKTGRTLKLPAIPAPRTEGRAQDFLSLKNEAGPACPRFTAQVVRNVKVAPSPAWLVAALESVGQRPINNIVDATNYLNFEFGQPCHAFDLAKLSGPVGQASRLPALIIRRARKSEPLTTLDGKRRALHESDLVVADAQRAQSLAGVIGGQDSEVTNSTTDIVLEVATWDPQTVRATARRHQVRTDASHRYERIVDPRTLDAPAQRLLSLIVDLTGGTPAAGVLDSFAPSAPLREIPLRIARVRQLLGIDVGPDEITRILRALHIQTRDSGPQDSGPRTLLCTPPPFRPDLTREIDLIEEIARIKGFDAIPTHDRLAVQIRPPQNHERAARLLTETLAAAGFYETVTFTFTTDAQAQPFLAPGLSLLHVADSRRRAESALRPSLLPSLLAVRKSNQDAQATLPGGLRLFEAASTFAEDADGATASPPLGTESRAVTREPQPAVERRTLALLLDLPDVPKGKPGTTEDRQHALRILRGTLESAARNLAGPAATLELKPVGQASRLPGFDPHAHAEILLNSRRVGHLGLISPATQKLFDLDIPLAAAELELEPLLVLFPPRTAISPLPQFPGIERDLSLIVSDATPWGEIKSLAHAARLDRLTNVDFVSTYRGKQIGDGKKSVTLRLTFRDPTRTLRHEEVDPQITALISLATDRLHAAVRS